SAFRSLLYTAAVFGILWFYLKGSLKKGVALMLLGVAVMADLWSFDRQHLGADKFVSQRDYDKNFAKSPADETILQDKDPHYRVFNTTAGLTSDSYTSYYHKSIGGYHGAKLIRYQDLIENQLSQGNQACYNMLNAKWYIATDKQSGQKFAQKNPQACGNAWFINNMDIVPNADAEMAALKGFDPLSTVIVDERYAKEVPQNIQADNSSNIVLTSYDPKHMVYEANVNSKDQFAVFSEIYYEGGDNDWKTYIDGEE